MSEKEPGAIRRKQLTGFTQVDNRVLNNPNLSGKAKGIYAYLYMKPEGWQFSADRICLDFKDGRRSILSGLKEIEDNGLIKRARCGDGRVVYDILIHPQYRNSTRDNPDPKCGLGTVQKPHNAETDTISNTEGETIKSISEVIKTKQLSVDKPTGGDVNTIITLFKEVNPSYQTLYAKKGERDAVERLLKTHGREVLEHMIQKLPEANQLVGITITTTPFQLEKNLGRIQARIDQEKNINNRKKKAVTLLGVNN